MVKTELIEIMKILVLMNKTFGQNLQKIINYNGYKITTLAKKAKISTKTIYNYINGESTPNIKTILSLICVMGLNARIAYRLLESAGYMLGKRGVYIDIIYMDLIEKHSDKGLDYWNKEIAKYDSQYQLP